ncbi:hypothetical protein ABG067_006088 [Albugo candida]
MTSCTPDAIFYILKEYPLQHQYIVVKISKILGGDPETCITPYLHPERYFGTLERHKLLDRTNQIMNRLGRYRQTFAWGATSLTLESHKRIVLYRQRSGLRDEQRILQIPDAAKAALRQKIIPGVCEIKIEKIDFVTTNRTETLTSSTIVSSQDTIATNAYCEFPMGFESKQDKCFRLILEVQPFCHPTLYQQYGLTGSGKVASSDLNALYFYPIQIERCNYRNVVVRVHLLTTELDFVPGFEHCDATTGSILPNFYGTNGMEPFALSSVHYHQKNPQFDDEIKVVLPSTLDSRHHLFITFYHVHCKKVTEFHAQQELIGYSALPLMDQCGRIVQDSMHTLSITMTPSSRSSRYSPPVELPEGYSQSFYDTLIPNNNRLPAFTCKTRVLSSIYSQDAHISTLLHPLCREVIHDGTYQRDEADCTRDIEGLVDAPATDVCFFLLPVAKVLFGYICFGSPQTRKAAFVSLLTLFDKVCTSTNSDQDTSEYDTILHDYVQFAFHDREIRNPSNPSEKIHRTRVYRALLLEWRDVLRGNKQSSEQPDTQGRSLPHAHIFLKLVLKSMAINLLKDVSGNTVAAATLPSYLDSDDETLVVDVLVELIGIISEAPPIDTALRIRINSSIAYFCRGLFLVVQPQLPSRIICIYMLNISRSQRLCATTTHVMLSFCKIIMEFELFVSVNGFNHIYQVQNHQSYGWLAQLFFSAFIFIVKNHDDDQIQIAALKALRHMFVLNAYDCHHQSRDDQERIALLYIPALTSLIPLHSSKHLSFDSDADSEKGFEMRKELSICIAHLISSLSDRCLSVFLKPASFVTKDLLMISPGRKESQTLITQSLPFEFGWLHCIMVTIRNLIRIYLIIANPSFVSLLSPDMKTSSNIKPRVIARARSKTSAAMSTDLEKNRKSVQKVGDRPRQANRLSSPMLLQRPALECLPCHSDSSLTCHESTFNIEERNVSAVKDPSIDGAVRSLQIGVAQNVLRALNKITNEFQKYFSSRRYMAPSSASYIIEDANAVGTIAQPDNRQAQDVLMEMSDLHFLLLSHSVQLETLCSWSSFLDEVVDKYPQPICFVFQLCESLLSYITAFGNNTLGEHLDQSAQFQTRDRLKLLLRIIAFVNDTSIRQCAGILLCKIFHISFEQQGTFHLIRETIMEIFHEVYYGWESSSSNRWVLTPTYLGDIVHQLRLGSNIDSFNLLDASFADQKPFAFHFAEALDTLNNQLDVYFKWKDALEILKSTSSTVFDYELLEEDIQAVMRSISPISMIDEKLFWLDALVRLHAARGHFAEAAYCKCSAAEYCLQSAQVQTGLARNRYASELEKAMEYVERAGWDSKKLEIWESMLRHARDCETNSEHYGQISQILARVVQKPILCDNQQLDFCFYRVSVIFDSRLDCTAPLELTEHIYKRSIFTSLGEFVTEIKLILKAKTSMSTSIELVPEGRSHPAPPEPDTIYFRTTVLKPVGKSVEHCHQYQYATPFTFSGPAYGSVSEQMKRVIYLTVPNSFPYFLTRQVVIDRREYVRCPIENAIEDIAKRNAALQIEIDKERKGCTESKALSLILKGSVDPEVHGGIPEVIRSFFGRENANNDAVENVASCTESKALSLILKGSVDPEVHGGIPEVIRSFFGREHASSDAVENVASSDTILPQLLDSTGHSMDSDLSFTKRLELANIILCFLQKCQQCLRISRKTLRQSASVTSVSFPTPLSPSFQRIHENIFASSHTWNEQKQSNQSVPAALNAMTNFLGITYGSHSGGSPADALEQLQSEFDKSFEMLLVLVRDTCFLASYVDPCD